MVKEKIITDLSRFSNKEMFAEWLWTQLCSWHHRRNGDLYLLTTELQINCASPVDGLDYVYRKCIPDAKQIIFRQAIGDTLLEWGNSEDAPIGALEDLVYLIIATKATESLSALLPTVGNGLLGKIYPEILFSTVACLRSFSPSPAVYETMLDLINSNNFDDGYLFEAIKTLTRCDPSQAASATEELKPRLIKLRERVRESDDESEEEIFWRGAKECGLELLSFLRK